MSNCIICGELLDDYEKDCKFCLPCFDIHINKYYVSKRRVREAMDKHRFICDCNSTVVDDYTILKELGIKDDE